ELAGAGNPASVRAAAPPVALSTRARAGTAAVRLPDALEAHRPAQPRIGTARARRARTPAYPARAFRRPRLCDVRDGDQLVVVERTHPAHHRHARARTPEGRPGHRPRRV